MEVFHWMCGVSSAKIIKIVKRLGLLTGARWHDSLVLLFLTDAVLVYGVNLDSPIEYYSFCR
jgi:hypothetical protein